jgi:hypothetical protein
MVAPGAISKKTPDKVMLRSMVNVPMILIRVVAGHVEPAIGKMVESLVFVNLFTGKIVEQSTIWACKEFCSNKSVKRIKNANLITTIKLRVGVKLRIA